MSEDKKKLAKFELRIVFSAPGFYMDTASGIDKNMPAILNALATAAGGVIIVDRQQLKVTEDPNTYH